MSEYSCASSASSAIPPSIVTAYIKPDIGKFNKITEQYHGIKDNLQKKIDESGDGGVTIEELSKLLLKTNDVFNEVKRPQEARLDIYVLKQVTLLTKSNIEKTTANILVFRPSEYADNLITYCKNLTIGGALDEDLNNLFDLPERSLQALASKLSSLSSHTCGLEPLYGALEWKPPKRKITQRSAKDHGPSIAKLVKKVSNLTTKEETSVDEVGRILSILKRKYQERRSLPICFLEFVINPKCFTTTIENIFHVSFLLRDGFVEIMPDNNKIACIIPSKTNEMCSSNTNEQIGCQAIVSMDMDEWKEAIEVLELSGKEPMIPVRSDNRERRSK